MQSRHLLTLFNYCSHSEKAEVQKLKARVQCIHSSMPILYKKIGKLETRNVGRKKERENKTIEIPESGLTCTSLSDKELCITLTACTP